MKTMIPALFILCSLVFLAHPLHGADFTVRKVDQEQLRVLLYDPETQWECWVEEGEEFKGWTVEEITPLEVYFIRQVSEKLEEVMIYPVQNSLEMIGK
ncbi:MAG: hypothetical protein ACP5G0_11450 [Desulfomonilia bacterium]